MKGKLHHAPPIAAAQARAGGGESPAGLWGSASRTSPTGRSAPCGSTKRKTANSKALPLLHVPKEKHTHAAGTVLTGRLPGSRYEVMSPTAKAGDQVSPSDTPPGVRA